MKYLSNFYISTLDSIQSGDSAQVHKNMGLFEEMLLQGIQSSTRIKTSNTLRTLDNYFVQFVNEMITQNSFLSACDYLYNLHKKVFELNKQNPDGIPFLLSIELGTEALLRKVQHGEFAFEDVYQTLTLILERAFREQRSSCVHLYEWLFYLAVRAMNEGRITEVQMDQLLRDIVTVQIYTGSHLSSEQLHVQILERISYQTTQLQKPELFSKLINLIYENQLGYHRRYEGILVSNVVYLYYLAFRESLVDEARKSAYQGYLTNAWSGVSLLNLYSVYAQHIWDYYEFVKQTLQFRELGTEQGKFLALPGIIDEFFLFETIRNPQMFNAMDESIRARVFTEENLFRFLQYFTGTELTQQSKENFSNFIAWFDRDASVEHFHLNIRAVGDELLRQFKAFHIDKFNKFLSEESGSFERYNGEITRMVVEDANQSPYVYLAKSVNFKEPGELIFTLRIPFQVLPVKSEIFTNQVTRAISLFIRQRLLQNNINPIRLPFTGQAQVAELVNQLKTVNPNVLVYTNVHDTRLKYLQDDVIKQEISSADRQIEKKLEDPHGLFSLYFQDKKLLFEYGGVKGQIRPRHDEEIEQELQQFAQGDQYMIPLINDIRVPFSKDEAKAYLKYSLLIVEVRAHLTVQITSADAAIIVTYH